MFKVANSEELTYREVERLESYLKEHFGLYGGELSYDAWRAYRRSNNVTLPFAGGWLDQPKWIRADFEMLDLNRTWHDVNAKRVDTGGLPSPYNVS